MCCFPLYQSDLLLLCMTFSVLSVRASVTFFSTLFFVVCFAVEYDLCTGRNVQTIPSVEVIG